MVGEVWWGERLTLCQQECERPKVEAEQESEDKTGSRSWLSIKNQQVPHCTIQGHLQGPTTSQNSATCSYIHNSSFSSNPSCSPGWLWTHYVAKDNPQCLILPCLYLPWMGSWVHVFTLSNVPFLTLLFFQVLCHDTEKNNESTFFRAEHTVSTAQRTFRDGENALYLHHPKQQAATRPPMSTKHLYGGKCAWEAELLISLEREGGSLKIGRCVLWKVSALRLLIWLTQLQI